MKTISTRKARMLRKLVKLHAPLKYYPNNTPKGFWERFIADKVHDHVFQVDRLERQITAYIRRTDGV